MRKAFVNRLPCFKDKHKLPLLFVCQFPDYHLRALNFAIASSLARLRSISFSIVDFGFLVTGTLVVFGLATLGVRLIVVLGFFLSSF